MRIIQVKNKRRIMLTDIFHHKLNYKEALVHTFIKESLFMVTVLSVNVLLIMGYIQDVYAY